MSSGENQVPPWIYAMVGTALRGLLVEIIKSTVGPYWSDLIELLRGLLR